MRQKLALITALAGFALITALGVGMAGAEQSTDLGGGRTADGWLVVPSGEFACANTADDDGDGLADLEDPDCESAIDESEAPEDLAPAPEVAPPSPAREISRH